MYISNNPKKMTNTMMNCLENAFSKGKLAKIKDVVLYEYKDDSSHVGLDERLVYIGVDGKEYDCSYRHNSGYPINIIIN
jgi:hypothetical protein